MQSGRVTSLLGAARRERDKGRRGRTSFRASWGVVSPSLADVCPLSSLECCPGVHRVRRPGECGETLVQLL